jgi:peptidyl-prolyl cis-trans isomerase SurA
VFQANSDPFGRLAMNMFRTLVIAAALTTSLVYGAHSPLLAQDQKVIVTVNDQPITSFDIKQRMNLWKLLGIKPGGDNARKRALDDLIDDIAKVEEAKKFGFAATEKDIDTRLGDFAKGLKTDNNGLRGKLKAQGISIAAMRQYLAGQIAFGRLIRGKYKEDFTVSDADVKKRQAAYRAEIDGTIAGQIKKLEADPRRRPVTVYEILEINFPIAAPEGGITNELLQARAIEANQYVSRFKGCGSARAAASGIFDVKVGRKIEADASKIPKPLRQAMDKAGPGRGIGPLRSPAGLQVVAFCGIRKISPPKIQRPKDVQYPNEKQVRGLLEQEKFAAVQKKYSGQFRKGLLIEYRDPSFGP